MSTQPPPIDDSRPAGECPRCWGSGFLVSAGGDGIERARPCPCRDLAREATLLRAARIPRRYEHCSLENYEVHHEAQGLALQVARRFVREYPLDEMGLLFTGPCGTGKTHLAVAILKGLVQDRGVHCLFYDFGDLLKEIQSTYSPESAASEMGVLQPILAAEVVVLDDLGAQKPTAWVRDTVAHIINNRYNERRTTLFTTNRPDAPGEEGPVRGGREATTATLLDQIGERIHSRLYEMCHVVPLAGRDYRKSIKKQALRSRLEGRHSGRRSGGPC